MGMEYRVLGRLEVLRDGEQVDLGAHRQRSLLAILLTNPNGVVAMDEIIDALWGDDASADRQNALWVYVSGLRKALEPEREKRTDGTVLLTRSPGYVIAADDDDIDAIRFERLVAEGRSLAETDPAAASLVLGEALALWRGKPYEEFTYDSFFQNEIARLEELRLEAVEERIDAEGTRPGCPRCPTGQQQQGTRPAQLPPRRGRCPTSRTPADTSARTRHQRGRSARRARETLERLLPRRCA